MMDELLEERYQLVFENTMNSIEALISMNNITCVEDFERKLDGLYFNQGSDQHGRGMLFDTMISAEIAAYEEALLKYKKENNL